MEREVTIERLAFGGEGVGRVDGKVVFVPFTAPGDRVRVKVTEEHPRYDRGQVEEFLEKSPHRVEPPCPVFGRCGGCQWQHLDYPSQVAAKEEILKDTLTRVGKIPQTEIRPMKASPNPWNYRDRIQLQVDAGGQVGFYAAGSHEVVPIERCWIANERLNERLASLRGNGKLPPGNFELNLQQGEVSLLEVDSDRVFSQVNQAQAGFLREMVIDSVFGRADPAFTKKWTVVELYCGTGNFTIPLAQRGGQVIAVDGHAASVAQAEAEAKRLGLGNIAFLTGDVEWGLKKVTRKKTPVDVLVLDPPRVGAKEVLDLVLVMGPRKIVYVSCDPATLARDLKILVHRQYRLEEIQPIDMFPQTYHIESVARLTRL